MGHSVEARSFRITSDSIAMGNALPRNTVLLALLATALGAPRALAAEGESGPKPLLTGSRSRHVHRVTLYDHAGRAIEPGDADPQPYSPMNTCAKCHAVGSVSHGWHFNAANPAVAPGRPGEPWFIADTKTQTQIPLSARGWAGTFKPQDVGVTSWRFVKTFGGHTPGGGLGAEYSDVNEKLKDPDARWQFSGKLEIDCLICHSAGPTHDPAEWARQVGEENFKWAPTAALGLASISGSAKALKPAEPVDDADPAAADPANQAGKAKGLPIKYDKGRFDANGRVFLDVVRNPPAERCYFCHTAREVGPGVAERWQADGDVHIRAGLRCADCHRNDINHLVTRGYEGEAHEPGKDPSIAALSCRGCHLGAGEAVLSGGGRLGAPRPQHKGLPPLHLDKLSCTACHSGPWPGAQASAVQTSLGHTLGQPTRDRGDEDWPLVSGPVMLHQASDGKIAPHRVVWPAYWGMLKDGRVSPLLPEGVKPAVNAALRRVKPEGKAEVPGAGLSDEQVAAVLASLAEKPPGPGEAVYVQRGRQYRRNGQGQLTSESYDFAPPYVWPVGHDVRPASQSLGVRGCADCHAKDAPLFAGKAASLLAARTAPAPTPTAAEMRGEGRDPAHTWAWSFGWRTSFKTFAFTATALLGAILLRYGFIGLGGVLKRIGGRRK